MSKYGNFVLQSGVVNGHEIKDNLIFKQVSLYQELIYFDIMTLRLNEVAGFEGWFSEEEKTSSVLCQSHLIFSLYLDETRLRQSRNN